MVNTQRVGRAIGIVVVVLAVFGALALTGLCLGFSIFVGARIL